MKITITLKTGNDSFQTWEDVKDAISYRLKNYEGLIGESNEDVGTWLISDGNGNQVGSMDVEEADDL